MTNFEKLGKEIFEFYTRNGFGKVLKTEIDQSVFHIFLLENLDKKYILNDQIRYYHINKTQIGILSNKACISDSRIKILLEQDFFRYGKELKIDDFLLETVNSTTIKKGILKSGKINFLVPNPISKKYIEQRISDVGGIPDYSFNRDILVLDIIDFLKIVNYDNSYEIAEVIRKNILAKSNKKEGSPEINAFISELESIPIEDRLKNIALGAAEKFIGKAGDEIIGAVFDLLKSKKES